MSNLTMDIIMFILAIIGASACIFSDIVGKQYCKCSTFISALMVMCCLIYGFALFGHINCDNCGKYYSGTKVEAYCSDCGYELNGYKAFCPECHQSQSSTHNKYCEYCGYDLEV